MGQPGGRSPRLPARQEHAADDHHAADDLAGPDRLLQEDRGEDDGERRDEELERGGRVGPTTFTPFITTTFETPDESIPE